MEFKRMNYFTGFFTTADDWRAEQAYHREKLKLHNRGLHLPGIVRGVGQELGVRSAGLLNVEIRPGAALDADGNEIWLDVPVTKTFDPAQFTLPCRIYVTIRYAERETDRVENVQVPAYSGNIRVTETPVVEISSQAPDNRLVLELARVELQAGVTVIADAADPDKPGGNEIDLRRRVYARSVCDPWEGVGLSPELLDRLIQVMGRTRRDFAALSGRFPTTSTTDVRQGAMTIDCIARAGMIRPERLAGLLTPLAEMEQDVGQELGSTYPVLPRLQLYQAYLDAVNGLLVALRSGDADVYLTAQDEAAEAARELSELVLQEPEAAAGQDLAVTVAGDEAVVKLDATASRAFAGRTVARYRWQLRESQDPPLANAGSDVTVTVAGDEATLLIDASRSRALGGRTIARYRWDRK